jgi:hypothetical protein
MTASKRYLPAGIVCLVTLATLGFGSAALAGGSALDPYASVPAPLATKATKKEKGKKTANVPIAKKAAIAEERIGLEEAGQSETYVKMPGKGSKKQAKETPIAAEPKSKKVKEVVTTTKVSDLAPVEPEVKAAKVKAVKEAKEPKHKVSENTANTTTAVTTSEGGVMGGIKTIGAGYSQTLKAATHGMVHSSKSASEAVMPGFKKVGGGLSASAKASGDAFKKGAGMVGIGFKATGDKLKDGTEAASSKLAKAPKLIKPKAKEDKEAKEERVEKVAKEEKVSKEDKASKEAEVAKVDTQAKDKAKEKAAKIARAEAAAAAKKAAKEDRIAQVEAAKKDRKYDKVKAEEDKKIRLAKFAEEKADAEKAKQTKIAEAKQAKEAKEAAKKTDESKVAKAEPKQDKSEKAEGAGIGTKLSHLAKPKIPKIGIPFVGKKKEATVDPNAGATEVAPERTVAKAPEPAVKQTPIGLEVDAPKGDPIKAAQAEIKHAKKQKGPSMGVSSVEAATASNHTNKKFGKLWPFGGKKDGEQQNGTSGVATKTYLPQL